MYYNVEYTYSIDEGAVHEMDLDPGLEESEMETAAVAEIKTIYPEIYNIKIKNIEVA